MSIIKIYLKNIAKTNDLDIASSAMDIEGWLFHHGMLFLSPYKWWQSNRNPIPAERKTLHEGLDILFFKDKKKQIKKLQSGTLIPAATDGEVINICDDFLGQSIVVAHKTSFHKNLDLFFIYAHILPDIKIKIGTALQSGDIIASIADVSGKKTLIPPHLHLSIIEAPENIPIKYLNWNFFTHKLSAVNLINPLFV